MNCIILAAGSGNRLRPLTLNKPKCLVEIAGKSLLSWQLESLNKAGIKNINIVVGYRRNEIINLKDQRIKRVFVNNNFINNNMVKSLLLTKEIFNSQAIISYSDIIYSHDLVLKLINSSYENAIIVDIDWLKLWSRRFSNPLDDAETLKFDNNYNLLEIGKKPKKIIDIMAQYIGLMRFSKETLKLIEKLNEKKMIYDNMYMTELIMLLLNFNIKFKVIPISRNWLEVDTLKDYEIYNDQLNKYKDKDVFSIFI